MTQKILLQRTRKINTRKIILYSINIRKNRKKIKIIKKNIQIDVGINYIATFAESTNDANSVQIKTYILEQGEDPETK